MPSAPRGSRPRRRDSGFSRIPEFRLSGLIRQELGVGTADSQSESEAEAAGQSPRVPEKKRAGEAFGRMPVSEMLELLKEGGAQPDTSAIARRAARFIEGPPELPWQYVAVSVAPAFPVRVPGGWELASVDLVRDDTLPLWYGSDYRYEYSPGMFHLTYGYGILRHPSGHGDAPTSMPHDETGRILTLPLLVLNLAGDHPVHAGVCYYVEPGRRVVWRPPALPDSPHAWFPPGELQTWERIGQDRYGSPRVEPRPARLLNADATRHLAKFAPVLGERIERLGQGRRKQLVRAADQHLTVAHRTPGTPGEDPALPEMHAPEAAFRWVSVIESLLSTDDNSQSDLTRKTAQRAAILIGCDDDDRTSTRDLVAQAYSVRSNYAHGNSPKKVDLAALRTLTRKIITAWIVLSADSSGSPLSKTLDDALLSGRILEESVRRPLEEFKSQVSP